MKLKMKIGRCQSPLPTLQVARSSFTKSRLGAQPVARDLLLHLLDDLSLPLSASITELPRAAGHLSGPQTRPAGSCFGAFALAVPFTQRHFSHIWMPHLELSAQMSPPHRGHRRPIKTSLSHTLLCCHFSFSLAVTSLFLRMYPPWSFVFHCPLSLWAVSP